MSVFPVAMFKGIPIYLNPFIPLRMTRSVTTDDYELMEVESDRLCMRFSGCIFIHPDRWDLFKSLVTYG